MPSLRRPPVVADLTLVTAGAMTANVAGYLLQLAAARWLGAAGYSAFASLLAVQLLCAVPALALQNVVAREMVRGAVVAEMRALGRRCALSVTLVALVLVPVVALVLQVPGTAAAGALASAPVLVLLYAEQGILQGHSRFRALAGVLAGAGVGRVIPALALLATGAGTGAALWGAAAGLTVVAGCAWWTVGPAPAPAGATGDLPDRLDGVPTDRPDRDRPDQLDAVRPDRLGTVDPIGGIRADPPGEIRTGSGTDRRADVLPARLTAGVLPVLRAAQVQAALMALSSADLIVARVVLSGSDASRYALGAVAAKIAFWLPQAVGVVLYPRMARPQHSARALREALAVLSGIGVVAVLGAALAAPLAPLLAGGDYRPVQGLLWLFALEGALLAVLQGALLSAIAADRTAPALVTWAGLGVEVVATLVLARSILALAVVTTIVVALVTATVVAMVLARPHPPETAD
ncbi:polysaccharide biosynthesis protein [Nocardia stercoris]|uniref:Polysaccharide biosynthesis protein n=1 Tax=Nocardia stercoris TaxID=2483361 RepID=A0A3M2L958_9NOCA|nr:polysaccharide biosynthesis protein [Nocardia stercoris]RMI33954.1 polysaccharide biosynthesis protein [Nocardia stercoris]